MSIGALNCSGDLPLSILIKDAMRGGVLNKTFGRVSVPALNISLGFGAGANQANQLYYQKRTLTATTYDNLLLSSGLTDGIGNASVFAHVKLALIAVVSPTGSIKVRVGPQGQTHAWPGPWTGGVGATVYKDVPYWDLVAWEPQTGYAVSSGSTDVFSIYNPGGASLDYVILLAGN